MGGGEVSGGLAQVGFKEEENKNQPLISDVLHNSSLTSDLRIKQMILRSTGFFKAQFNVDIHRTRPQVGIQPL